MFNRRQFIQHAQRAATSHTCLHYALDTVVQYPTCTVGYNREAVTALLTMASNLKRTVSLDKKLARVRAALEAPVRVRSYVCHSSAHECVLPQQLES